MKLSRDVEVILIIGDPDLTQSRRLFKLNRVDLMKIGSGLDVRPRRIIKNTFELIAQLMLIVLTRLELILARRTTPNHIRDRCVAAALYRLLRAQFNQQ